MRKQITHTDISRIKSLVNKADGMEPCTQLTTLQNQLADLMARVRREVRIFMLKPAEKIKGPRS